MNFKILKTKIKPKLYFKDEKNILTNKKNKKVKINSLHLYKKLIEFLSLSLSLSLTLFFFYVQFSIVLGKHLFDDVCVEIDLLMVFLEFNSGSLMCFVAGF